MGPEATIAANVPIVRAVVRTRLESVWRLAGWRRAGLIWRRLRVRGLQRFGVRERAILDVADWTVCGAANVHKARRSAPVLWFDSRFRLLCCILAHGNLVSLTVRDKVGCSFTAVLAFLVFRGCARVVADHCPVPYILSMTAEAHLWGCAFR